MNNYERLRHELDTKLVQASSLSTQQQQQDFVTQEFLSIHKAHEAGQVDHNGYVRLVNRLASYKSGAFNDYLDSLVGAAQMNMLDLLVEQVKSQDVAAQSRQRRRAVTELTGVQPVPPDDTK